MTSLLWVLLLALAWTALMGELNTVTFFTGIVLGYILVTIRREAGTRIVIKGLRFIELCLYFLYKLMAANLRVAWDVLTPPMTIHPGVIAVPLDLHGEAQVTLLANIITLTPGSVTLDISEDRRVLYVHTLYADDPEAAKQAIKRGFERRIRELFE